MFYDTPYTRYTHTYSLTHIHTHNHRDSRLHYPSYPAIARVRSPTSRRPPSLSHSLSFSLCLSLSLSLFLSHFHPVSSLPHAAYGYSPCNKSPLPTPGGGGRLVRPTHRVESRAFPPPTNGRATPPWSRGGGHLLSLNGYDGGARIS